MFLENPALTLQRFQELCQRVYFPTEDYSISVWIIVHCGLFYLFWCADKSTLPKFGLTAEDVDQCRKHSAVNAESAIQRLRVCTDPTLDNTEALILAVRSKTQSTSLFLLT